MKLISTITFTFFTLLLTGCQNMPDKPITTVDYVDIDKFMGDWYVIANIPTFIEKGAHNAIETYRMTEEGNIATTFSFNKDSFDGERKEYNPMGYIVDKETNSVWGMQFIWPIKADYRVVYLDEEYTQTIIGREKRDYVWIMARTPEIPDDDYKRLLVLLDREGYDINKIQKVPQNWPGNKSGAP